MECSKADGRELWVLAEIYHVRKLKIWLIGEIDRDNVCAAYEFWLVPEGVERNDIMERCSVLRCRGLEWVSDEGLKGVGVGAMKDFVLKRIGDRLDRFTGLGWRFGCGWSFVMEGFFFAERWLQVNGGAVGGPVYYQKIRACIQVVEELDLMRLPLRVLKSVVRESGLVSDKRLVEMCESKMAAGMGSG